MSHRFHTNNRALPGHPLFTSLAKHLAAHGNPSHHIYLGWGYKASGLWAHRKASNGEASYPNYFLLEDAFVRSIFPGYTGLPIYGIIADSSGMYYDYEGNTDLIHVLNGAPAPSHWAPAVEPRELEQTLSLFRQIGASKYNCFSPSSEGDLSAYKKGVLVVDQTRGDARSNMAASKNLIVIVCSWRPSRITPSSPSMSEHIQTIFTARKTPVLVRVCLVTPVFKSYLPPSHHKTASSSATWSMSAPRFSAWKLSSMARKCIPMVGHFTLAGGSQWTNPHSQYRPEKTNLALSSSSRRHTCATVSIFILRKAVRVHCKVSWLTSRFRKKASVYYRGL